MSINETLTSVGSSEIILKNKALTVKERLERFLSSLCEELLKSGWESADAVMDKGLEIMEYHIPQKKGNKGYANDWFTLLFPNHEVGDTIDCESICNLTDGKFAFNNKVLKRWADPAYGIPYGSGRTAVITFHRRLDADHPAFYSLDAYNNQPSEEYRERKIKEYEDRKARKQVIVPLFS